MSNSRKRVARLWLIIFCLSDVIVNCTRLDRRRRRRRRPPAVRGVENVKLAE